MNALHNNWCTHGERRVVYMCQCTYIPVLNSILVYIGMPVLIFLFDIDTGTNKNYTFISILYQYIAQL